MTDSTRLKILAGIVALFVLVYLLAPILSPFLVGMAIAYLGDPLVDRMKNSSAEPVAW